MLGDCLDTHHLAGPDAFRNDAVCLCHGSESTLCCLGFLHASVVLLLERQVCVHSEAQPMCRMLVESYNPVSDSYLDCEFMREIISMASPGHESCHLSLGMVKL